MDAREDWVFQAYLSSRVSLGGFSPVRGRPGMNEEGEEGEEKEEEEEGEEKQEQEEEEPVAQRQQMVTSTLALFQYFIMIAVV